MITKLDKISSPLLVYIVLVGFLLIAVAGIGVYIIRRNKISYYKSLYNDAQWVAIPAVIEYSKVEEIIPLDESKPTFSVNIKYRYEYDGVSHTSTTISRFLDDLTSEQGISPFHAKKLEVLFPKGTHVTAFVDQRCPTTAVLSLQDVLFTVQSKWFMFSIFIFAIFGFVCLVFALASLFHQLT